MHLMTSASNRKMVVVALILKVAAKLSKFLTTTTRMYKMKTELSQYEAVLKRYLVVLVKPFSRKTMKRMTVGAI